jgi:membrane protein DedA with SNARE-associated domain
MIIWTSDVPGAYLHADLEEIIIMRLPKSCTKIWLKILDIPESEWNTKITEFMKTNGSATIFILSIIPNPFFDIAGITAGATNFPIWKFIFFSFFGKWIKFSMFALMGKKINTILK